MTHKKYLSFLAAIFLFWTSSGCEKKSNPFSADAVQPTTGQITTKVIYANLPEPNVQVVGIDPSGNSYTITTDSNGLAIFNPLPFINGNWNIQIPNQNVCWLTSSSQIVNIPSGTSSSSVTFNNNATVQLLYDVISQEPFWWSPTQEGYIVNGVMYLNFQNGCGLNQVVWNLSVDAQTSGSGGITGPCGSINVNQNCNFQLSPGEEVEYIMIMTEPYGTQLAVALSSVAGSASSNGGGYCCWDTTGGHSGINDIFNATF